MKTTNSKNFLLEIQLKVETKNLLPFTKMHCNIAQYATVLRTIKYAPYIAIEKGKNFEKWLNCRSKWGKKKSNLQTKPNFRKILEENLTE